MKVLVERSLRAIPIFRQITHELRQASAPTEKVTKSQLFRYLVGQMREHRVTQALNLEAPNEVEHIAAAYSCYLTSTRRLAELQAQYSRGERSVAESANLVGLRLPVQPPPQPPQTSY